MTPFLPVLFLGVALLYSMAGFGGGSSYIALLAISGLPLAGIPVLALSCNLMVASQGSVILGRAGHLRAKLLKPLLCGSIPAAFLAGAWRIDSHAYLWILTIVLTGAGMVLLLRISSSGKTEQPRSNFELFLLGGFFGGLAGLSGIGGGIFLAPVLHLLRAEKAQAIAAASALFITLNSAAGLVGQLTKGLERMEGIPAFLFILCPVAVLMGGFAGSRLLALDLSPARIRTITGIVVLLAAARLWLKLLFGA